jgi:hypothetical protein
MYSAFIYSLKVWLTSVLATSLIIFAIISFPYHGYNDKDLISSIGDGLTMLMWFVFLELIFSFFTWVVFSLAIMATFKFSINQLTRKWLIFFIGIILTILTFILFSLFFFRDFIRDPFFLGIMFCNCFCIGCGIWLYKLKK